MNDMIAEYMQLLRSTAHVAGEIASAESWHEDAMSEASLETERVARGDEGLLTVDSVRTSYSIVQIGIHVCAQYARAASNTLHLKISPLSVEVLARAAVETAATTWWISEQDIGARRRVCRSQLLRINSAMELKKLTDEIGDLNTDRRFGELEEDVVAYSDSLGLGPFTNQGRRRNAQCELDVLPTYSGRAKDLLTFYGASHAYMMLSGSAHAELWSIFRLFQAESNSSDPLQRLVPNQTAIRGATNVLLLSLVSQIDAAFRLFGWTREAHRDPYGCHIETQSPR